MQQGERIYALYTLEEQMGRVELGNSHSAKEYNFRNLTRENKRNLLVHTCDKTYKVSPYGTL